MVDAKMVEQAFRGLLAIHKNLDYMANTLSFLNGPVCIDHCGVCCHQSVVVTELSAQYIAYGMLALPKEKTDEIKTRLRTWLLAPVAGVRPLFSNDGVEEAKIRFNEYNLINSTWCPLLAEDYKCMIHPWRDVTCRAWGVTRPPDTRVCPRPIYDGEEKHKRKFIMSKDPMVEEVQKLTSDLVMLFKKYPEVLRKSYLPTLLYQVLEPEDYAKIKNQIQEAKRLTSVNPLMWILTKEEADFYCGERNILENSIKVC